MNGEPITLAHLSEMVRKFEDEHGRSPSCIVVSRVTFDRYREIFGAEEDGNFESPRVSGFSIPIKVDSTYPPTVVTLVD